MGIKGPINTFSKLTAKMALRQNILTVYFKNDFAFCSFACTYTDTPYFPHILEDICDV